MADDKSAAPAATDSLAPATASLSQAAPFRAPVSFWLGRKRPPEPQHEADRRARVMFDVLYAGAAAAGRWEPDFTLLTEDEFDQALKAAGEIQLGGR